MPVRNTQVSVYSRRCVCTSGSEYARTMQTWAVVPSDDTPSDPRVLDVNVHSVLASRACSEGGLDAAVAGGGAGLQHVGDAPYLLTANTTLQVV